MKTTFIVNVCCPLCGEIHNSPYRYELRVVSGKNLELGHNICRSCALQYVSPRPDSDALAQMYNNEYHTATVSGVYNVDSTVSKDEYAAFCGYIQKYLPSGGTVLDVGCGVGNLLQEISRDLRYTCSGVEVSKDAAHLAKDKGFNVVNATLSDANLVAESFDGVALLYVLEHVSVPLGLLQEIHRVLKDDGYFFLAVPNYRYLHLVYESVLGKLLLQSKATLHPEEHLQNFTPVTLRAIVEKAGFILVEHNCARPLAVGPWPIKALKKFFYMLVKAFAMLGYNIGGIHFVLKKSPAKN